METVKKENHPFYIYTNDIHENASYGYMYRLFDKNWHDKAETEIIKRKYVYIFPKVDIIYNVNEKTNEFMYIYDGTIICVANNMKECINLIINEYISESTKKKFGKKIIDKIHDEYINHFDVYGILCETLPTTPSYVSDKGVDY